MAIFNSYVKLPEGIPCGCLMENHHCSVRSIIQIHGGFGQKPWMAMVVLLTTIFDYLVSVIWVLYDIYYIYGIDYIYIWMVLAMSTLDEQPPLTAVRKVPP